MHAPWIRSCVLAIAVCASAQAAAVCTVTTTGVIFGAYDPVQSRDSDIAGSITVICSGAVGDSVSYQISIGPGRGTFQNRQMFAGAQGIRYNIFLDATRSRVWGDGTQGTGVLNDVMRLTAPTVTKNYVVYGRIMGNQRQLRSQRYFDNLLITVAY